MQKERNYIEKLEARILSSKSRLCVGLDPRLERHSSISEMRDFLFSVIEETAEYTVAFKPNMAYFEFLGSKGIRLLEDVLKRIPQENLVILDAKRSDIGESQKYYARAYFENWEVDAVTLNPFLGYDSLEPFLDFRGKGIYLLALTSNKGNGDFQTQMLKGKPLFKSVEQMAFRAREEGRETQVGLVFGLNHRNADYWKEVDFRKLPLLIPGFGVQEGDLSSCEGFSEASRSVVNVSRGILYGEEKKTFAERALNFRKKIAFFSEVS